MARCRFVTGPVLAALLLMSASASAQTAGAQTSGPQNGSSPETVAVRVGDHPGFGRIVFDLTEQTAFTLARDGDRLTVRFAGAVSIGPAPYLPRNVRAITGGDGRAEITLAAGATARGSRMGTRVVIDVADPPPKPVATKVPSPPSALPTSLQPMGPSPVPSPAPPLDITPAPLIPVTPAPDRADSPVAKPPAEAPAPAPRQAATDPPPPEIAAPATPPRDAGPVSLFATRVTAPDRPDGAGEGVLAVPFGPDVGAAAFRRAGQALVVFDERRPIDLSGLHDDKVFAAASVQLLPGGTLLRIELPPDGRIVLGRTAAGWTVAVRSPPASAETTGETVSPIRPVLADGKLILKLATPGQVVAMIDPDTGSTLLVGTLRVHGRDPARKGLTTERRMPGFVLLPSWAGVAVEPLADDVALRPMPQGFALSAGSDRLSLAGIGPAGDEADALADAASLTRRYDFPPLSATALVRRLREQIAAAAAAPALARGRLRQDVAQTMIALGLGAEAQGVLDLAVAEDPKLAADPDTAGLGAIAALVAGRPEEAGALASPALSGTDEIAFWRAVRAAQGGEAAPDAAAAFSATAKLALAYPPTLAAHVLPLALETMAAGGEAQAAAPILAARKDDPTLGLARATLAQANGDVAGALAGYDALASGADRLARARAGRQAIDLRLATNRITPAEAASQLDKLIMAWRGDWRERALRERLASVQAQSGAWGSALATLREAEALFPDDRAAIHGELVATFADMLRRKSDAGLSPIDLVALIDQNADLVPDGPAGLEVAKLLADRLAALDLPGRAAPLLDRLMRAAPAPAVRADLGATLASMRLQEGDAAGALAALAASAPAAPGQNQPGQDQPGQDQRASEPDGAILPPALAERRALLSAEATARSGDVPGGLAALAAIGTDDALLARATIAEQAHDWDAASRTLADYVRRAIPPDGKLDDAQQRIVLRWASAAAEAGDAATLAELRGRETPRMQSGALADMFRLLAADPVRKVADLKRVGQETRLARALPEQLKALESPTPTQ